MMEKKIIQIRGSLASTCLSLFSSVQSVARLRLSAMSIVFLLASFLCLSRFFSFSFWLSAQLNPSIILVALQASLTLHAPPVVLLAFRPLPPRLFFPALCSTQKKLPWTRTPTPTKPLAQNSQISPRPQNCRKRSPAPVHRMQDRDRKASFSPAPSHQARAFQQWDTYKRRERLALGFASVVTNYGCQSCDCDARSRCQIQNLAHSMYARLCLFYSVVPVLPLDRLRSPSFSPSWPSSFLQWSAGNSTCLQANREQASRTDCVCCCKAVASLALRHLGDPFHRWADSYIHGRPPTQSLLC